MHTLQFPTDGFFKFPIIPLKSLIDVMLRCDVTKLSFGLYFGSCVPLSWQESLASEHVIFLEVFNCGLYST